MTRPRRVLLYMPGDDRHKIEKAITLGVDCMAMDLEDGVAANRKSLARETVCAALTGLDFGPAERLVRINPVGSDMAADDLSAVLPARPDGIILPKVESADQVRWVSGRIAAGRPDTDAIRLLALVETARGIVNLPAIAASDSRLEALIFGAEDLAGDVGATRTAEGREVFYARSAVVIHAAACGLQSIDMVKVDFTDLDGLAREAQEGAQLGYWGKQAIHPRQVAPILQAFTPSAEEVARAQRVVAAYAEHAAAGTGAFALDGQMVDLPLVKAAERVLARAGLGS